MSLIRLLLAGDPAPNKGEHCALDRRLAMDSIEALVVFIGDGGISREALGEICYAASKGIPYVVCASEIMFSETAELMVFWGARVVIRSSLARDESLKLAMRCFSHNPKGETLWPFDIGDITTLLALAESPIEERLGIHLACRVGPEATVVAQHPITIGGHNYRLDFVIDPEHERIVVECDGHDFHERTKEQAARDKSRDRALVSAGWKIMRFTGSEIWADPGRCAREVHQLLTSSRNEPEDGD